MIVPVLGCPRGGTTVVTGILQLLGVDMGAPLSDDHTLEDLTLRQRQPKIIAELCWTRGDRTAWGWKDPTLIDRWHLLALLLSGLDVRPVVVMRDPHAIATTEQREPSGVGYAEAMAHTLIRLPLLATVPNSVTVSYEHTLRDPLAVASTLRDHLDITIGARGWTGPAILDWVDPAGGYAHQQPVKGGTRG